MGGRSKFTIPVSNLFSRLRGSQGLKQKDVAAKADITASALSLFEAGKTSLSDDTRTRLAAVLNLNPDYLSGKSKNPYKSKGVITFLFLDHVTDVLALSEIIKANDELEFVTIYPYRETYYRFGADDSFPLVPYALAIKDQDVNIFLFKNSLPRTGIREKNGESLRSEILPLLELNDKDFDKMKFRDELTSEEYIEKIDEGTITRKDLEPFFAKFKKEAVAPIADLTGEEIRLINKLRENKINPEDVAIPAPSSRSSKKVRAS